MWAKVIFNVFRSNASANTFLGLQSLVTVQNSALAGVTPISLLQTLTLCPGGSCFTSVKYLTVWNSIRTYTNEQEFYQMTNDLTLIAALWPLNNGTDDLWDFSHNRLQVKTYRDRMG